MFYPLSLNMSEHVCQTLQADKSCAGDMVPLTFLEQHS
jgi:hypothetical protein